MSEAVYMQILETVRDKLRDEFSFGSQGGVRPISRDAIVIKKTMDLKFVQTPGIIVHPGRVLIDPTMGTNARDDYAYPVLCQIIDRDASDDIAGLKSYLKWQEQIARGFQQQKLTGVDELYIGTVRQVDVVDERLFRRHPWFVSGVVMTFLTRMTRGVT
jgi:hypothetical protein